MALTTYVSGEVLTAASLNDNFTFAAANPVSKIVQVVSTAKTDTFTTASTSYTDVTGLSVSITPTLNTSKIMVFCMIQGSQDVGVADNGVQLVRDSTAIALGDASGSHLQVSTTFNNYATSFMDTKIIMFLDNPATTSATTYKIQIINQAAGTAYINRTKLDSATSPRGISTITVMEILA
jgi:hypothetical protein